MSPPVRIPEMEEFMSWPNGKKFAFIAIGNYFKTYGKNKQLNRADVYRHMKNLREAEKLIFVEEPQYEKMVWGYVNDLLHAEYITKTKGFVQAGKEHYWFTITKKGTALHRRVSFALNVGPEEIIDLASKTDSVKFASSLKNLEGRSYPAPSLKKIKEALDSLKKEVKESEKGK